MPKYTDYCIFSLDTTKKGWILRGNAIAISQRLVRWQSRQTMREPGERICKEQDPRKMIEFGAEFNPAFAAQEAYNSPDAAPAKAAGAAAPIPKPPRPAA